MKVNPLLLFALIFLIPSSVQAQKMQSGEFLSKNGDYLKVINDSQLISNITSYEDVNTYQITNDSIITSKKLRMTDAIGSRDTISRDAFKLLVNSPDTLSLRRCRDQGTVYESIDTITFARLDRLLRPLNNFQLIVLKTFSGFYGTRTIQIDRKGNLLYIHVPLATRPDAKPPIPKKIIGKLTKEEFQTFLHKLSKAMIVPTSLKGCFVLDYSSEMTISVNGRNYNFNHCTESYLHNELTSYLVKLEDSKGIKKSK